MIENEKDTEVTKQIELWQIDAYLDGFYDAEVEQHLAQNPAVAQQFAADRSFEEQMSAVLHRFSCPETDELLNYQWGFIDEEEGVLIAAHLAKCEACQVEAQALAQPDLSEQPTILTTLRDRLPVIETNLHTFLGRLIPQEQVLVPVTRSAVTEADVMEIIEPPLFYINAAFPDLENDPNGFSGYHIYSITKVTAVAAADNLYLIKLGASANGSFEQVDWQTGEGTVCYIKKVAAEERDRLDQKLLYHIDIVEEANLLPDEVKSYYTIVPIDKLLLDDYLNDDAFGAYHIMKLTVNEPTAVPLKNDKETISDFTLAESVRSDTKADNEQTASQLFTVDELGLDIVLNQFKAVDNSYRIEGQVLNTHQEIVSKVSLIQNESVKKSVYLSNIGAFAFEDVDSSQSWLCFHGNGVEVCLCID